MNFSQAKEMDMSEAFKKALHYGTGRIGREPASFLPDAETNRIKPVVLPSE